MTENVVAYYNSKAHEKTTQYESQAFETFHPDLIPYLPSLPAKILDVGAGSGRDAAALASKGYDVTAVEPAHQMLKLAKSIHRSHKIRWIEDKLPQLEALSTENNEYSLIIVSAVWMHLTTAQREEAIQKLAKLLLPKGKLLISFKSVQKGNHVFHPVDPVEFENFADKHQLTVLKKTKSKDTFNRANTQWTSYILEKTDA